MEEKARGAFVLIKNGLTVASAVKVVFKAWKAVREAAGLGS